MLFSLVNGVTGTSNYMKVILIQHKYSDILIERTIKVNVLSSLEGQRYFNQHYIFFVFVYIIYE